MKIAAEIVLYSAKVVIQFSGVPRQFDVLVKLPPDGKYDGPGFDSILNEEMLWNKGTPHYGKDFFPKIHLADLGKYGRPVIVVEDFRKSGYARVLDRKLNLQEARCIADFIGRFHKRGMELKDKQFTVFREFYSKFQETVFTESNFQNICDKMAKSSQSDDSTTLKQRLQEHISKLQKSESQDHGQLDTICQGRVGRGNFWFKEPTGTGDKLEVRIFDWGQARRGSGCFDLYCLLRDIESEHRTQVIEAYIDALGLTSSLKESQLRDDLAENELIYALLVIDEQEKALELLKV
ncbi:hypothetical protein QAD02_000068 [Eretmocerus hayati]|uniref:Uncharacterized protein n=1 Tax=Eretmocerus hayati TaxID=131215 RepID=A0ACC2NEP5_9HYME|nr:hypothetical protein QAD02_000068 [Eretmocerus hayati]